MVTKMLKTKKAKLQKHTQFQMASSLQNTTIPMIAD